MTDNEGQDRSPRSAVEQFLFREIEEHCEVLESARSRIGPSFEQALDILEASIRSGGKVLLFGNGGSAADAQHLAAELVVRYKADRPAIAAVALTTDTSALTACGNDLGFEALFARQIEALGRSPDVALGISTSGKSANVLAALHAARKMGLRTIGFAGAHAEEMAAICDTVIAVPSRVTARVQEMHIMIGHALCKLLEQRLGLVTPHL
jgi:D-sedoheptulose 7-phosphate isomerase